MKGMEDKVLRSMLKTFDTINTRYIVVGEHGSFISDTFPIGLIAEVLKKMGADFEIRHLGENYTHKTKASREYIYRDLADVFSQIKVGELVTVKIPEHLDFEKARSCIINYINRTEGYGSASTHKLGDAPGIQRMLQIYVAPKIIREAPSDAQQKLPYSAATEEAQTA